MTCNGVDCCVMDAILTLDFIIFCFLCRSVVISFHSGQSYRSGNHLSPPLVHLLDRSEPVPPPHGPTPTTTPDTDTVDPDHHHHQTPLHRRTSLFSTSSSSMWIISSSPSSLPPFDISSYVVELVDAREVDGHNLMGRGICRGWRGREDRYGEDLPLPSLPDWRWG